MAIQTNETNNNNNNQQQSSGNQKKKADGYLNLKVVDVNGNPHNIKCYIALDASDRVHAALMNKGKDGAEIALVGHVNIVDNDTTAITL